MGYHKDLGTSVVHDLCPLTGYPRDKYGHLLNPISDRDGAVIQGWDQEGTELYNFTNPYGFLEYAVGSGDDFHCFDFRRINAGPRGRFIILDATINSETGHFIESGGYNVLPCNTKEDQRAALDCALGYVCNAIDWCGYNEVRHTKRGWNQSPFYFANNVAKTLFDIEFQKYDSKTRTWKSTVSEREIRHNSKRVERIIYDIRNPQ
jgi:hypothetical protein